MRTRVASLALMVAAVVLAAAAVALTAIGRPDATVRVTGGVGSTVESVVAGGPLWRAGIRRGQSVIELSAGIDQNDWALVTTDGTYVYTASFRSLELALRESLPTAAVALALAALAWIFVRSLALGAAVGAMSLIVSGQTLLGAAGPLLSSTAAVAATLVPVVWLWAWGDRKRFMVVAAVVMLFGATVWLVVRNEFPSTYDSLELVRQASMALGMVGVALVIGGSRGARGRLLALDSSRVVDLLAIVGVLSVAVAAALVVELPAFVLILVTGGALILYPSLRRRLATTVDQMVFGEIRGRASLQAVEDERGRIARDIHDAPLQEISAVIRELDRLPDAEPQAELLRSAAGHLRRVTTELRPPVLDDLGLQAALAHVAEQAALRAKEVVVEATIIPDNPLAPRAPAQVELAVFRIVQEAVDNALRHAKPNSLVIHAVVMRSEVDVSVQDDGIGIEPRAARDAARNGHMGLATMAQRAAMIGAAFSVTAARTGGTEVRVRWRAP